MARKKNSSFQGASVLDADVTAPSFERTIANAVGDTALIFDKVTGQNSEASTIIHDGSSGRGARLGIPLVNQWIGRSLFLTSPSAKSTNGGRGETWVLCYSIFLVPGETGLQIEVAAKLNPPIAQLRPTVTVMTTGLVVEKTRAMEVLNAQRGESDSLLVASIDGLSSGLHYVAISLDSSLIDDPAVGTLHYCRIRPRLPIRGSGVGKDFATGIADAPGLRDTNDYGVTAPAAAEGLAHRNFDASMFANLESIDAYITAGLNRNLNGLAEYITGWPAGNNAAYVQRDDDGGGSADATDPARVRFEYHSQALYGVTEPQIAFPIWAECFGAFVGDTRKFAVNLAQPPTNGMLSWYAPWPITTTAQGIRRVECLMPDFQSASSNLKMHVLLGSDASSVVNNWGLQVQTSTGNSGVVNPTAADGTNTLWHATITGIPFTGDRLEDVVIAMSRTGSKSGIGEVCVINAALYFEP